VPAVAVIRGERALSVLTGRKAPFRWFKAVTDKILHRKCRNLAKTLGLEIRSGM